MTDIRERFLNDVENHSIQVLHDDGVYRHLRFDESGSSFYHFNLTTWPGYLCISGDMGCFTFSRLTDMFRFFRDDELRINAGYWAEKVQAGAGSGRDKICKKWSQELFEQNVKEHVRCSIEGLPFSERRHIWQEVKRDILTAEDEWSSVQAVRDFNYRVLDFCDFWESDATEYTTHYLWCCYAIVWGIQQYDAYRVANPLPAPIRSTAMSKSEPKFKVGQRVLDTFTNTEFTIVALSWIGGEWSYTAGWYFIPESDLKAVSND